MRKLDPEATRRVRQALGRLTDGASNLDVRSVTGRPGWLRLRVGDQRVLFRRMEPTDGQDAPRWFVARVVDRRDLDRAVVLLP